MIVTTGNEVAGKEIEFYGGIVRGIVVRTPGFSAGITGAFQAFSGGNVEEYTRVCDEARQDAYDRMVQHAQSIGADAVIGFRYDATEFMQSTTEVLAYGTAVKFKKESF